VLGALKTPPGLPALCGRRLESGKVDLLTGAREACIGCGVPRSEALSPNLQGIVVPGSGYHDHGGDHTTAGNVSNFGGLFWLARGNASSPPTTSFCETWFSNGGSMPVKSSVSCLRF